jgi:hypothetical protein
MAQHFCAGTKMRRGLTATPVKIRNSIYLAAANSSGVDGRI